MAYRQPPVSIADAYRILSVQMFVLGCGRILSQILTAIYYFPSFKGNLWKWSGLHTNRWVVSLKLPSAVQSLKFYDLPQLALAAHPGKNPDNEEATRQFQRISEGYPALASYLNDSGHRHEHVDSFNEWDDRYRGERGYSYIDLGGLQFYL